MPKFQSGPEESESASVTRHTVPATTVIGDILVITRAVITAIMAVIHITERITILDGRTTTATTDTTGITRVTTATKTQRLV